MNRNFWEDFWAGLISLLPLGITIFFLYFLINFFGKFFESIIVLIPYINRFPHFFRLLFSSLILLLVIYLLGLFAMNVVGKWVIGMFDKTLQSLPLIQSVYRAVKKLATAVFIDKRAFKEVVWLTFPTEGSYALGFITGEITSEEGEKLFTVFVPTTPNPTSGYLLYIREEKVIKTSLSIDKGLSIIMSGGIISNRDLIFGTSKRKRTNNISLGNKVKDKEGKDSH